MKRLFLLTIPIMALMVRYDLWAEPKPPSPSPAFSVMIQHRSDNEITLEVEKLEDTREELILLAKVVESESGNQPILGRKMVIDAVLNRKDSEEFPDTITEVVNQKNQFACMSNGMAETAQPSEETWKAIAEELTERTNDEVLYFRTEKYPAFGEPVCQIGDHYFSK